MKWKHDRAGEIGNAPRIFERSEASKTEILRTYKQTRMVTEHLTRGYSERQTRKR
jgi:hypothetical protein